MTYYKLLSLSTSPFNKRQTFLLDIECLNFGVDFYIDCVASSFQEAQGANHDGSGSASGEMTAVISITI